MNKKTSIHWSFWIIAVFALIWNVMGCINLFMQMSPDMLAKMPESHRAIAETRPAWASGAFALSVFGGAFGGLLLLLRKSAAFHVFIASLLGVVATMIHALGMAGAASHFSPSEIVLAVVMPVLLAVFLIWYSKHSERNGSIR